ncbi:MAG: IclR family transcriptional regulator [Armatimonadetes bacterium]|nr:IclR family transcriptional regulator [Armatimonadota bacterium]
MEDIEASGLSARHAMGTPARLSEAPARTLDKGLTLLGLFDVDHPEWTLRELREHTGFPKATTARLMKTLEVRGWVACDSHTGKYHLGSRVLQGLFLATSHSELARKARPFLQRLTEETKESSNFCVWTREGALIVDTVIANRPFVPRTTPGMLLPGLASADAQVLVAFGPEEAWDTLLAMPLEPRTDRTITDPDLMRERWRKVRREGVAFDCTEWTAEAPGVAAPVLDPGGRAIGSISVCGPIERCTETEMMRWAAAVVRLAAELSTELGQGLLRSRAPKNWSAQDGETRLQSTPL